MPDFIITLTTAQATRLAKAVGMEMSYIDPATPSQVKDYIRLMLKMFVIKNERQILSQTADGNIINEGW